VNLTRQGVRQVSIKDGIRKVDLVAKRYLHARATYFAAYAQQIIPKKIDEIGRHVEAF
jgi:hypothetical protein